MAIRNLAQLKTWFGKGAYPTAEQFADWLDSFFFFVDKVTIGAIDQLPERLNSKYERSSGEELERGQERLSGALADHQAENDIEFGNIYDAIGVNRDNISVLAKRQDAQDGVGGPLKAKDFGTDEPTDEALTEYAARWIWDRCAPGGIFTWNAGDPASSTYVDTKGATHTASEIFNSTYVRNEYKGLNYKMVLTNTPNTTPTVFEWEYDGVDTVHIATPTLPGIFLPDDPNDPDAEVEVIPGTGGIKVTEKLTTPAAWPAINAPTLNTKKTLKEWMLICLRYIDWFVKNYTPPLEAGEGLEIKKNILLNKTTISLTGGNTDTGNISTTEIPVSPGGRAYYSVVGSKLFLSGYDLPGQRNDTYLVLLPGSIVARIVRYDQLFPGINSSVNRIESVSQEAINVITGTGYTTSHFNIAIDLDA